MTVRRKRYTCRWLHDIREYWGMTLGFALHPSAAPGMPGGGVLHLLGRSRCFFLSCLPLCTVLCSKKNTLLTEAQEKWDCHMPSPGYFVEIRSSSSASSSSPLPLLFSLFLKKIFKDLIPKAVVINQGFQLHVVESVSSLLQAFLTAQWCILVRIMKALRYHLLTVFPHWNVVYLSMLVKGRPLLPTQRLKALLSQQ